jgi:DNA ligase 1
VKAFAQLYLALDATTSTTAKLAALQHYFAQSASRDAAWATYFLAGGKPRQTVKTALLRQCAREASGLPEWLFEESYQAVGDLAETIAHVLPPGAEDDDTGLADWVELKLMPLRGQEDAAVREALFGFWNALDMPRRFLLTKLIGGGFRVGVSKLLVQRALAAHAGIDAKVMALRMMGYTDIKRTPSAADFARLVAPMPTAQAMVRSEQRLTDIDGGEPMPENAHGMDVSSASSSTELDPALLGQPYPFFLAHALEAAPHSLGDIGDWLIEWKYDGIRAQVVKRCGQVWVWSRGEELVTDRFPEVTALAQALPDGTVLDGEAMVWRDGAPGSFALLQQRIGRKVLNKKVLADAPVTFMAYDVLEWQGRDVRNTAQRDRRNMLESIVQATPGLRISPLAEARDWDEAARLRLAARARGVEGLMLKAANAHYGVGRTKADGLWLKWKVDPMSVDCVLVYAQAGHGRRASLYTDYTFAVWQRAPKDAAECAAALALPPAQAQAQGLPTLVAFAKAYSGLTDDEFRAVDAVIRKTTIDKFGPVRSVMPSLVFELGFEGIAASPRHKSGIAVRFPRMLRRREDKPLYEADTMDSLRALLRSHGGSQGEERAGMQADAQVGTQVDGQVGTQAGAQAGAQAGTHAGTQISTRAEARPVDAPLGASRRAPSGAPSSVREGG